MSLRGMDVSSSYSTTFPSWKECASDSCSRSLRPASRAPIAPVAVLETARGASVSPMAGRRCSAGLAGGRRRLRVGVGRRGAAQRPQRDDDAGAAGCIAARDRGRGRDGRLARRRGLASGLSAVPSFFATGGFGGRVRLSTSAPSSTAPPAGIARPTSRSIGWTSTECWWFALSPRFSGRQTGYGFRVLHDFGLELGLGYEARAWWDRRAPKRWTALGCASAAASTSRSRRWRRRRRQRAAAAPGGAPLARLLEVGLPRRQTRRPTRAPSCSRRWPSCSRAAGPCGG